MPVKSIVAILFFLFTGVFALHAQKPFYNFSSVDIEDGLSHNQVYAIYRDSIGFVWFGTSSGLNRFDGYSCKSFFSNPADSTSLADDNITEIFPLPDHKIWIGAKDGASIFDPLAERFNRNIRQYLNKLQLPQGQVKFVHQDKKGHFWFLFHNEGLFKYVPGAHKAVRIKTPGWTKGNVITHLSEDTGGNIWLVFSNGMLIQINAFSLQPLQQSTVLSNYFKGRTWDFRVFVDRRNNLWTYTNSEPNGVYKLQLNSNAITHFHSGNAPFRLNDDLVRGIVQDLQGAIWIGADHGGITVVRENNNQEISYLVNKESDRSSLGHNSIERLYQDQDGIVWVGTTKKGVSYFNQNIVQFELYKPSIVNSNSLPFNDINYFTEDRKGNVWIGTNGGGLIYFDRINNKFTRYVHSPANPNSLSNNVVVSLCLDREDKLWIGTYLGGLSVFDGKSFIHYRHNPSDPFSLSDNGIWHILEDHKGSLWIGTLKGGLNKFDRKTQKFTHYAVVDGMAKPLHSNYISVVREDRGGNLWIGTSEGIEVHNKERTHFTHYRHTEDPFSLSHQNVTDIREDKRGFIWVGTRIGLNVFNRKTGKFKRFSTNDGLPDHTISNIAEDRNGNLWLTTPKGLCQLIVEENKDDIHFRVRNFSEANNLQGKVFNESACMVTSKGLIFVGGPSGFNIIDPAKVSASKKQPSLVFTSIDIFKNEVSVGQSIRKDIVLRKALPYVQEIELSYLENIFSLEFTALDFSRSNQYAYKLEGFNKNWMFTSGNNRKVTYTNLDPGTYYFKVKATNSDGVWGSEEKTLKILIHPPFWRTPLALMLYALVVACVLYISRRYVLEKARMRFEVKQQRKERERMEELDAVKTKFFTNVSHEFRTPLSLILTPLGQILHNTTDTDQKKHLQLIYRNAKRLLNLVNQLLDFRKMEVQKFPFHPTEGDIIDFLKDTCHSFSDVSEMKNVSLSFSSNLESFITSFDQDKLEKIMFNLLSNAFKYTPAGGSVAVQVIYSVQGVEESGQIEIIVSDSGIGISPDKIDQIFEPFFQTDVPANISNPGTGIGLAITKEFVKLHNGTISVRSEPGKGSAFTISLPVQKSGNQVFPQDEKTDVITTVQDAGLKNTPPTKKRGKNRPVLLLVEDSDDFRFYLKDNLKQEYDIVEASNGQDAWDLIPDLKPDMIVSDVMMPYMDGIELTKRVKEDPVLSAIPIVLLTAAGDEEMQLESYRLGVSEYMTKPFTYEILASRIKSILAQTKQAAQKPRKVVEVQPSEVKITPVDEQFMKQVLAIIEKNMSNPDFSVEELSKGLCMHRAGMYRKLLSLTGMSPLEFIRNIRLKRAAQLLEKSGMNITEIAYEVGFNSPKKFSQYFKEEYGMTPSQFHKQKQNPT